MDGLIIDNFAGGGGASTGIEAALGCAVDHHSVVEATLSREDAAAEREAVA